MHLVKWYLDLTCDDGSTVIAYWAKLELLGLRITWSHRLLVRDGQTSSISSLARVGPPTLKDGKVDWVHQQLGIEGEWTAQRAPICRALLETSTGSVTWDCLVPRAQASISVDGRRMGGWGYVERLTMTIPPWALPLDQLRWGRFLAVDCDLVWIEWVGPKPLRLLLVNGGEATAHHIADDSVAFEGGRLELNRSCVLREGRIGPNLLRSIPGIDRIAPASMLAAHERKWLSRAVLHRAELPPIEGWSVHEIVAFRDTAS